jgi:hypothetical protein
MTVLLKLLPQLINREHYTTTEARPVEEAGVLVNREFPEGFFNEFLGRARIIVPLWRRRTSRCGTFRRRRIGRAGSAPCLFLGARARPGQSGDAQAACQLRA